MRNFDDTKRRLDQINKAIRQYDPVLREKARDILLLKVFGDVPSIHPVPTRSADLVPSARRNGESNGGLNSLMDAWPPKTQSDRALLCAYYLQHKLGYPGMTGRQLQKNLKKFGLRLTNVTVAIIQHTKIEPPRMRKTKIRGKKQNYYVVTAEGIKYVENKLTGMDWA